MIERLLRQGDHRGSVQVGSLMPPWRKPIPSRSDSRRSRAGVASLVPSRFLHPTGLALAVVIASVRCLQALFTRGHHGPVQGEWVYSGTGRSGERTRFRADRRARSRSAGCHRKSTQRRKAGKPTRSAAVAACHLAGPSCSPCPVSLDRGPSSSRPWSSCAADIAAGPLLARCARAMCVPCVVSTPTAAIRRWMPAVALHGRYCSHLCRASEPPLRRGSSKRRPQVREAPASTK